MEARATELVDELTATGERDRDIEEIDARRDFASLRLRRLLR